MTSLHNLTPHPLVITTPHGTVELAPHPDPPRVQEEHLPQDAIHHAGIDVPVVSIRTGTVTGLPQPVEGRWYVVARVVALAAPQRDDLLVPQGFLRDADGNVTACTFLARLDNTPPSN
jgi:hypothetical protein